MRKNELTKKECDGILRKSWLDFLNKILRIISHSIRGKMTDFSTIVEQKVARM